MKDIAKLEIFEYFQILGKRRWYFLVSAFLTISGALAYARWVPNVFKSETRILVDTPMVSEEYFRSNTELTPADRINSIREQLASRTFLERMIEQLQMYGYGTRIDFVMENAIKTAQKQIGIEKTSDRTFTVSFVATDPQFAQTVTRQLAQELIRLSTRFKTDKAIATDQFIDEQLRQSIEALKAQEEKTKQFRLAHIGELPEQSNANMTALTGLRSQLNSTESAIQQAQERLKLLDFRYQERKQLNLMSQSLAARNNVPIASGNVQAAAPEEVELATKKELLAQYMAKYTPSHPDVLALTRDITRLEQQIKNKKAANNTKATTVGTAPGVIQEEKKVDQADPLETEYKFQSDSIKVEIDRGEKEKQLILQQIKLYQGRLNLAPTLEQELAKLLRDQDVLRVRYENLQRQKFNTQMTASVETDKKNETYRIIDEANLPIKPESPNRLQIVLLGIVGGMLVGIGAAFGREMLDNTIGNEEEAKKLLNLPILVTIPTVPKKDKRKTA
jgi:polysaccharide chain length determinant protein (PEP-CTERM system associated)